MCSVVISYCVCRRPSSTLRELAYFGRQRPKSGVEKSIAVQKYGKSVQNFGFAEVKKATGEQPTSLEIRKPKNHYCYAIRYLRHVPSFQQADELPMGTCFDDIAKSLVRLLMVEPTSLKRKQSAVCFDRLIILFTKFRKIHKCSESAISYQRKLASLYGKFTFFYNLIFALSFYQILNTIKPHQIYTYCGYDVLSTIFFEQSLTKIDI